MRCSRFIFGGTGALLVAMFLSGETRGADVRIGVFGLFAPVEVRVRTGGPQALRIKGPDREARIEGGQTAVCRASASRLNCEVAGSRIEGSAVEVAGESFPAVFRLSVPDKIERQFEGRLRLTADGSTVVAVVSMERETAVASIVAAESPPDAALEAQKAQAVAARSYLLAGARHEAFDFCDTTHCQFLRELPRDVDIALQAAASTKGLVLTHDDKVVRALYSRSCGGVTRTLREAGIESDGYPFFSVVCEACRREPETWEATFDREVIQPLLDRPTEALRLALAREAGWSTLPSTRFRSEAHGDRVTLHGTGVGHGIGLCQKGAAALAQEGSDFRAILGLYFPNTSLSVRP